MNKEITHCLSILKEGGLILYPTDTVGELVVMHQMLKQYYGEASSLIRFSMGNQFFESKIPE